MYTKKSVRRSFSFPWIRIITSFAMRRLVCSRNRFFSLNIISAIYSIQDILYIWPILTRSRLNFQRFKKFRLQRGWPSRGCAATEDRPASLWHHLAARLHIVGGYTHAAICDITVSINHYGYARLWMIMIANVSLWHHHAFFRWWYYMIVAAAVGGEAGFAPTAAGRLDRMIHAYGNGIIG